jgi:hypothetical protein
MVSVTTVRDSGIEILDAGIEDLEAEFNDEMVGDVVFFRTEEPVLLEIGESVGNPMYVEAQYFIAASVEGEVEDEIQQMMTGEDYVEETSIFVSNEDGEMGGGVLRLDDTADTDAAIEEFEEEHF